MTSAKFIKLITNSTGTTWMSGADVSPATVVHVLNDTGTDLVFRRQGDTDATFVLPDTFAWSFRGLSNSNQLQFRRLDTTNTPVTAYAEVELENRTP